MSREKIDKFLREDELGNDLERIGLSLCWIKVGKQKVAVIWCDQISLISQRSVEVSCVPESMGGLPINKAQTR